MGLKVIDGTPTAISKYLREQEKKGCGKFIYHHVGRGNVFCQENKLCKECSSNHSKQNNGGKNNGRKEEKSL